MICVGVVEDMGWREALMVVVGTMEIVALKEGMEKKGGLCLVSRQYPGQPCIFNFLNLIIFISGVLCMCSRSIFSHAGDCFKTSSPAVRSI